jgi:phytoene desaturase
VAEKVIVIGAGISALATAARLAAGGYKVEVFEKNTLPGGKIGEIRGKGYRFDTGPSLFTLPGLVDELSGRNEIKLNIRKLETVSRYFYPDGTVFEASADPGRFARSLSQTTGAEQKRITRYLEKTGELYDLTAPVFIFSAFHRLARLARRENMGILKGMLGFNPMRSMHAHNKQVLKSPKAVQLFDRYATYNGSSPYRAPATLNIIAHLEHNLGAYMPEGGMYRIVSHVYDLAVQRGVIFHFNTEVDKILIEKKKTTGIMAGGQMHDADFVVYGGDIFRGYRRLLEDLTPARSIRKPSFSSSAIIFYLGVRQEYPLLDVHNIFFSNDYRGEFDSIFSRRKADIFPDPTVYIYISSRLESSDAPPGCSNLFVMINVPASRGEDWQALASDARRIIFDKLMREYKLEIEPFIEFEMVATPEDIEAHTLSTSGALYGSSSNSVFAAFNRHPNFSRKVKNLFFAGGSVHPGGGIPLCLASAKIVEEEMKKLRSG